ncbi:MAG: hypothetical protein HQL31_07065 [Planctomycetes bacterium]|nr:hypothetical protein [Planctomycetota bacterium]
MDKGLGRYPDRIFHAAIVFFVLGLLLIARLFQLQIHQHRDYSRRLLEKLTRTDIYLTGRGKILDRNNELLAEDIPKFQLSITVGDLALKSGIVQELEYRLYPSKNKFKPFRETGIPPTPSSILQQKILDLDRRLEGENLLRDLSIQCDLDLSALVGAIQSCLLQCEKRWYYLSDAQTVDIFIEPEKAFFLMGNPNRFSGFSCVQSALRFYNEGSLVSHIVGYMGRLNEKYYKILRVQGYYEPLEGLPIRPLILNETERTSLSKVRNFFVGISGVEMIMNEELRGRLGRTEQRLSIGRHREIIDDIAPERGHDVKLTLDLSLQRLAREAMGDEHGIVVLFDMDEGDILISLSTPGFDSNQMTPPVSQEPLDRMKSEPGILLNKCIRGEYPFGSIFKVVSATVALEEGAIDAHTLITCNQIHTKTKMTCLGYHGPINVETALEKSCNIFFFESSLKLGIDKLYSGALQFGLSRKPDTGLPYEKVGILPNPYYKLHNGGGTWWVGDTCNTCIGQGYQRGTPMQAAITLALISRPEPVARPRYWMDRPIQFLPPLTIRDLTRETVRYGLWKVVNSRSGTARSARSDLIVYAGKTGTADVTRHKPDHPDYIPPHAWFVGFAPFDKPKVAIAVLVENSGHGGDTAAPIAKTILDAWWKSLATSSP